MAAGGEVSGEGTDGRRLVEQRDVERATESLLELAEQSDGVARGQPELGEGAIVVDVVWAEAGVLGDGDAQPLTQLREGFGADVHRVRQVA